MDRKQKIKEVIGGIITLGIIIVLLDSSTDLVERKESDSRCAPFFEQEEDFDVLFLGTSHVVDGIYPMELWNDYGIVSYNYAGYGTVLPTSYWVMENALDHTSPKLVVIDCYLLSSSKKMDPNFLHSVFDAVPLSKTKVNAVFDLLEPGGVEGEDNAETISRTEVLWDFIIYHNRWNELSEDDFRAEYGKEKGAISQIAVQIPDKEEKISAENKLEKDTVSVIYLEKMIKECQDRGIDVLLTYLPARGEEYIQREANRVYDIAEKYGVNYINFLDMDIVNRETDYFDTSAHLNVSGARKVTDYLGQYIMENYSIPDQRENEAYSDWYIDYADYVEYKISNLREIESLDNYLMLLADKNYSAVVEINNPEILYADSYIHLFENLGVNSSEITENTDFLLIQEAGRETVCFENFHESGSHEMTPMGEFSLFMSETGDYGVYLDNEEIYIVTSEQNGDIDIRITVIDRDTTEIVDQCSFSDRSDENKTLKKIDY